MIKEDLNLKNSEEKSSCDIIDSSLIKVHFEPCEMCKEINVRPTGLSDSSRLLNINVNLKNVCPNRQVILTALVFFEGNLVQEKTDVFKSPKSNDKCLNLKRIINIILPKTKLCSPLDVSIQVSASYFNPCSKCLDSEENTNR